MALLSSEDNPLFYLKAATLLLVLLLLSLF